MTRVRVFVAKTPLNVVVPFSPREGFSSPAPSSVFHACSTDGTGTRTSGVRHPDLILRDPDRLGEDFPSAHGDRVHPAHSRSALVGRRQETPNRTIFSARDSPNDPVREAAYTRRWQCCWWQSLLSRCPRVT